jgi:hypothetical protein
VTFVIRPAYDHPPVKQGAAKPLKNHLSNV